VATRSILARTKCGKSLSGGHRIRSRCKPEQQSHQQGDQARRRGGHSRQFKIIMDDPRWVPFLRKIGRAPDQLEEIKFDVRLTADEAAA